MPAVPFIIMGGASIVGSYIAAKGNKDAAKTQAASDDKALGQAKEIYQTQRSDQSPFRESGYGALDALNFGLGLPAVTRPDPRAPTGTPAPYVVPGAKDKNGNPFPGAGMPDSYGDVGNAPIQSFPVNNNLGKLGMPSIMQDRRPAANSMVRVQSPSGSIGLVPQSMLQQALDAGGKQV
jgi:hypothetical protein